MNCSGFVCKDKTKTGNPCVACKRQNGGTCKASCAKCVNNVRGKGCVLGLK